MRALAVPAWPISSTPWASMFMPGATRLGQESGEIAEEGQGAQPFGLDAPKGIHELLLLAHLSREPFHRPRIGVEALDLLGDLSHVALTAARPGRPNPIPSAR